MEMERFELLTPCLQGRMNAKTDWATVHSEMESSGQENKKQCVVNIKTSENNKPNDLHLCKQKQSLIADEEIRQDPIS